ncbi:hypothetical protein DFQ28_003778 [Apophysomyces sp. BC1034]|nr:hypothetical protein DFQ28_003778 [Apophysomyces sp. BC1034]
MAEHLSNTDQLELLRRQGFVVVPGLLNVERCDTVKHTARAELAQLAGPVEFEADLHYPGAPRSHDAPGGRTVRRLLDAYARSALYRQWATSVEIRSWMKLYFGEQVVLSRAHHNSMMTKHPAYGSLTGWHRDIRYWAFEREALVSVWLALGPETVENGALWFVPGSHTIDFAPECFDDAKFFRTDVPENAALIRTAISPTLQAGDVVFFHCNTLHSAGKNLTGDVKFSLVFTYHGVSNAPVPGTRSAARPGVPL